MAIKAVRKVVEAIGDLASWEWKEWVKKPDEHGDWYGFAMEPKGIPKEKKWFCLASWSAFLGEKKRKVSMGTELIFWGSYWKDYDYPGRVKKRLRRAWEIAEEWRKKANKRFRARLKFPPSKEVACYECEFNVENIYSELVRRNFKAMKYAFFGARKQLEKEGIVITEKIVDLEEKLEHGLEITEEDIKAALGEE